MYHGNLNVYHLKELLLLLLLLLIVFINDDNINNSQILVFKGSCLKRDKATFIPPNVINLFIVYELDTWLRDLNVDFALKDCLFAGVKLAKNPGPDKYSNFLTIHKIFEANSSFHAK